MNSSSKYDRWELLVLLSCAFFFHQFDRAIFGSLLSQIRTDLSLSGTQSGVASSTLFLVLAALIPLAGFASDRWSRKYIIILSLVFGSLGTVFTGFAGGVIALIVFRSILTGGAAAFYSPSAYPLLAEYHKRTRSTALAVHQGALYFSLMTSGFIAVFTSEYLSWRGAYVLFGVFGLFLSGVLVLRLRNDTGRSGPGRIAAPVDSPRRAVKRFFGNRTLLLLTAGYTSIVFVNNSYIVWAPAFIEDKFELPNLEAAGYSMLYHHLAAFFGIILGGVLTDRLVGRFVRVRLFLQGIALLLGVPGIILFGSGQTLTTALVATALFGFFRGVFEANTHAAVFDYVDPEHRGATVGLMTMTAYLIGAISPFLLGLAVSLSGETDGLSYGFSFLATAYLTGSLAVLWAWHRAGEKKGAPRL